MNSGEPQEGSRLPAWDLDLKHARRLSPSPSRGPVQAVLQDQLVGRCVRGGVGQQVCSPMGSCGPVAGKEMSSAPLFPGAPLSAFDNLGRWAKLSHLLCLTRQAVTWLGFPPQPFLEQVVVATPLARQVAFPFN